MSTEDGSEPRPKGCSGEKRIPRTPKRDQRSASLGPLSQAEAEALANDLREAQAIAAEYQRSLALKSTDLSLLKDALEKAMNDLTALTGTVAELRGERHRLAAELMRLEWLREKVITLAKRVVVLERNRE